MLQECERTLYETVEWDESLMERFEEGKRLGQYPRQFDYIEYVEGRQRPQSITALTRLNAPCRNLLVDNKQWGQLQSDVRQRFCALPNLRIILEKHCGGRSFYPWHRPSPSYVADVFFQAPTSLSTFSSILDYSLKWKLETGTVYSPVHAIAEAMVGVHAWIIEGDSGEDERLFRGISAGVEMVLVGPRDMDDEETKRHVSIRELARLVIPAVCLPARPQQHQLHVQIDEASEMYTWIDEVCD